MKKGQVYEGIIEKVEFPNKGIIQLENKKIIIKDTLKGQKIRFLIQKVRKDRAEARLLEILDRADIETEQPFCPHFGICGGCTYQTIPYKEQLKMKESQVRELIETVCPHSTYVGIKESPGYYEYRNKMEFSFGDEYKDGPLALGMHKKGSFYDIVTVSECRIVDTDYRKILTCVLEHFQEQNIPFYQKMRHTGILRHLLVRKAVKTQHILIDLVTASDGILENKKTEETLQEMLHLQELIQKLTSLPLKGTITGILHTLNDSLADAVKNEKTYVVYGQDYFFEELLGLKFKITPFSFFQTNSLGAEVLYTVVREFIGETKNKVIFDLYSGTGTIAQILAPVAKKVIGVEIVEEAVEAAKENAQQNHLENCEFIAGDVLKVLNQVLEKPDIIVVDPPREGIHLKALEKIIHYGVDKIVYISCKPTSLVRDLEILQMGGYRIEKYGVVDLFAWTGNVETIALLSLKTGTPKIEVTMADSDSNYS